MSLSPVRALHRFGLGAAPGELTRVANDPTGWLWRQTEQESRSGDGADLRTALRDVRAATSIADKTQRQAALRALFKRTRNDIRRRYEAGFVETAASEAPFLERLTWFWTNHFTVSAKGKPRVAPFVWSFIDDAIRPHLLGRFEDMLLAVEQHPAMLVYLDNVLSVGPNSPAGRRSRRGLNENLAREILELHTLGVDGGYGQRDVVGLARLITGWTTLLGAEARPDSPAFSFMERRHEPGEKAVLGVAYGAGRAEGERALRDIARRPKTARFIAGKLCRHFIADAPPPPAVAHVAARFAQTGGDLRKTAQALIEAAGRDSPASRKFRSPMDHVAAVVRAVGPSAIPPGSLYPTLIRLGEAPFLAGSPAGYSDRAADLAAPDAVLRRIEWAAAASARVSPTPNAARLGRDLFGDALSAETAAAIDAAESEPQALALLFASPEFMWR